MANQEHLARLKQGGVQWNQWRKQHPDTQPDLSDADLKGADLIGADLIGANLSYAHLIRSNLNSANLSYACLTHSNLSNADLCHADLSGADLRNARLNGVNLSNANLSDTNLRGADLRDADLRDANLSDADLRGAIVGDTIFAQVDLREAKGLSELNHHGPSRVELHTIRLPLDGSAMHFLRGAGMPEEWITIYQSTMMHPIQYYSCFISYSSKDEALAKRLHADLQDQGVRCWFAPENMKTGDEIRPRIDEAIHLQEKVLLLLSTHSIHSDWVKDEVEAAFDKEDRQKRLVLFPIRLDESVIETTISWAAKLRRQRHIGDFTNWTDPDAYQVAFTRLLRDLKKATS